MLIFAPISAGELFDKITILQVKQSRLTDAVKLDNVRFELDQLQSLATQHVPSMSPEVNSLVRALFVVNSELWDIEDGKRRAEVAKTFDAAFIELARSVYIKNDLRASLKRKINDILGSKIVEEKSHSSIA